MWISGSAKITVNLVRSVSTQTFFIISYILLYNYILRLTQVIKFVVHVWMFVSLLKF